MTIIAQRDHVMHVMCCWVDEWVNMHSWVCGRLAQFLQLSVDVAVAVVPVLHLGRQRFWCCPWSLVQPLCS